MLGAVEEAQLNGAIRSHEDAMALIRDSFRPPRNIE
jgi:hypothetical protein